jgi:prepilin-type processing-associated H-X9-DG protein
LLAVAVTAGAEIILWSSVTFGGQQGGVLFGDGHVTIPLLCAAAVLATGLGILDRRNG